MTLAANVNHSFLNDLWLANVLTAHCTRYGGQTFQRLSRALSVLKDFPGLEQLEQEAQLMLTTGSTRLAVSRGQQT